MGFAGTRLAICKDSAVDAVDSGDDDGFDHNVEDVEIVLIEVEYVV